MKLIVGLGNPGSKYDRSRHNAGFMALDNYAFTHQLDQFETKPKLSAAVLDFNLADERTLLAKPTTFMNRSGEALINIKRYYAVDSASTLVIYDDVDLPFGTVRVRRGGGSGGHNGIRSLPSVVRDNSWRIRIGVGSDQNDSMDTADYVLSRFIPEETDKLGGIFSVVDELIDQFIRGNLQDQTIHPE